MKTKKATKKPLTFKLIKEARKVSQETSLVEDNCTKLVGVENTAALYESAQELLGKVVAQLSSGRDPGSQDEKLVRLVTGLKLLSDPVNASALNMKPVDVAKLIDLVGVRPEYTDHVAGLASHSPSVYNQTKNEFATFSKMNDAQKREVIAKLNKLRLTFAQLKGKVPTQPQIGTQNAPGMLPRRS